MEKPKYVSFSSLSEILPETTFKHKKRNSIRKKNKKLVKKNIKNKKKEYLNRRNDLYDSVKRYEVTTLQAPTTKFSKVKRPRISSGEKAIKMFLVTRNIRFDHDKEYEGLFNPLTNCRLRFDFFLPDHKIAIEFDGRQHFQHVKEFHYAGSSSLESQQYRDEEKDKFCKRKKIRMIRISYKEYKSINQILSSALNIN